MEKTTSRKLARKRLAEAQQQAAAARDARERENLADLTEFTVRLAQVDAVNDWLAGRITKLKDEAERKRAGHRRAAGKALHAMRLRGESMSSISVSTGLSVNRLRELLKAAVDNSDEPAERAEAPGSPVEATPNLGRDSADGVTPRDSSVGAH